MLQRSQAKRSVIIHTGFMTYLLIAIVTLIAISFIAPALYAGIMGVIEDLFNVFRG